MITVESEFKMKIPTFTSTSTSLPAATADTLLRAATKPSKESTQQIHSAAARIATPCHSLRSATSLLCRTAVTLGLSQHLKMLPQRITTGVATTNILPLFAVFMLMQHSVLSVQAGSCREAQLCCNGRDSSCVVQKTPINAIIEDLNDKPCYCDHACIKLGDCCTDFKDHCGVLDCQVSDWGQWSDCNASCGAGTMTRTRKVIQNSQNGGKHCPTLVQKRGCQGFRCHGHHHDKKILRETALLLPAALSHRRHINDSSNSGSGSGSSDKNHISQMHPHHDNRHHHEEEYCVEFEVLRSSKACHKLPPYNLMIEGDRIAVRCDLEAFLPDLMDLNNATGRHHNNPSSLKPKLEVPYTSAAMDEEDTDESEENMIDNSSSSGGGGSSSSSSSSDEHDDYDTASLTMKASPSTTSSTSTTTTTTTTATPYPPLQMKQYHCRGEGLPGRTTRWTALAAPSCRGKWLRLTLDAPQICSHPQFAFV